MWCCVRHIAAVVAGCGIVAGVGRVMSVGVWCPSAHGVWVQGGGASCQCKSK